MYSITKPLSFLALLCLCAHAVPGALPPSDWGTQDRIWQYQGRVTAESYSECDRQLRLNAVQAAVGRLYFGEERFLARELLERYLEQYYNNFVVTAQTLERSQRGLEYTQSARVSVAMDRLFTDLKDKLFVYVPKSSPIFHLSFEEHVDEAPAAAPLGRQALAAEMDQSGMARMLAGIGEPAPGENLMSTPELMAEARRNAQAREVELFLTGTVESKRVDAKQLYFKEQVFYETTVQVWLIRVDDGQNLFKVQQTFRAARPDDQEALAESARLAMAEAWKDTLAFFRTHWSKTMQAGADYRLLLNGFSEEELEMFRTTLTSFHPSIRLYQENYFGQVAVVNFDFQGDPKMLDLFFQKTLAERYQIQDLGANQKELTPLRF